MDWIDETAQHATNNEVILCPTDTIWGISGNALNNEVVERIYTIKNRPQEKSFILLVSSFLDLQNYVSDDLEPLIPVLLAQSRPTTVIYTQPKSTIPSYLLAADGSIAIRVPKVDWLVSLLSELSFPLISTSANQSGQPSPLSWNQIDQQIVDSVDYVSKPPKDLTLGHQSQILRLNDQGEIEWIRK